MENNRTIAELEAEINRWHQHHEAGDCSSKEYFTNMFRLEKQIAEIVTGIPGLTNLKKRASANISEVRGRVHYKWFHDVMRAIDKAQSVEALRKMYAGWKEEQRLKNVALPELSQPMPKARPAEPQQNAAA